MSDKPLLVIPEWTSESSPHGGSYWNTFLNGCPHKRNLDKQYKELIKEYDIQDSDGSMDALKVGAAFHKILEHYYSKTLDTVAFDEGDASVAEALRLFNGYRQRFPAEEFAEVVGAELSFGFDFDDPASSPVGVVPFTGRYDMVVRATPENIETLTGAPRFLPISEPGVYILDTKTMSMRRTHIEMEMSNSIQFHSYMMAWDALAPSDKDVCKGFIANCVVKHKTLTDRSFFSVFVPPPTPEQAQAVRAHFQDAKWMLDNRGHDFKNRAKCFEWGRVCSHFQSGACDRG